jgi:hypothetical protein
LLQQLTDDRLISSLAPAPPITTATTILPQIQHWRGGHLRTRRLRRGLPPPQGPGAPAAEPAHQCEAHVRAPGAAGPHAGDGQHLGGGERDPAGLWGGRREEGAADGAQPLAPPGNEGVGETEEKVVEGEGTDGRMETEPKETPPARPLTRTQEAVRCLAWDETATRLYSGCDGGVIVETRLPPTDAQTPSAAAASSAAAGQAEPSGLGGVGGALSLLGSAPLGLGLGSTLASLFQGCVSAVWQREESEIIQVRASMALWPLAPSSSSLPAPPHNIPLPPPPPPLLHIHTSKTNQPSWPSTPSREDACPVDCSGPATRPLTPCCWPPTRGAAASTS